VRRGEESSTRNCREHSVWLYWGLYASKKKVCFVMNYFEEVYLFLLDTFSICG